MRQPLIISAGMPRAGSGWYYNLVHDLVVSSGGQDAREIRKHYFLQQLLTEVNCNISTLSILRITPVLFPTLFGNKFAIKTHAGPTSSVRSFIKRQQIYVVYIYRDPRAALLSAYEYGQRAAENMRPNAFSKLDTLDKAADFMNFYVSIWEAWSRLEKVLNLRYEDLVSNYRGEIEKTANFLDLDLESSSSVIEDYQPGRGDPDQIGTHFSQGEAERFRRVYATDQLAKYTHMFESALVRMGYEK